MKLQQEANYQRMIQEDRERHEEKQRKKEEEDKKRNEEELALQRKQQTKNNMMRYLKEEPTDASDSVKIAFRMPSGERVLRTFCSDEKVGALFGFIHSHIKEEEDLSLLHDYPPVLIGLDDIERTLSDFFNGSTQEIVIVQINH